MIDLLDFVISSLLAGKSSTAVIKKMFVNIANFPKAPKTRWFWAPFTDFATLKLDDRAYKRLIQIWSSMEVFFRKFFASLQGEVYLLGYKLYIRTCERKEKFESDNMGLLEQQVEQMSPREVLFEWLEDVVDFYFDDKKSVLPNLRKAVPSVSTESRWFPDVADVAVKEGSVKGRDVLKQRLRDNILMAPDIDIKNIVVEYFSQIVSNSKDVWRQQLNFITIPELELDRIQTVGRNLQDSASSTNAGTYAFHLADTSHVRGQLVRISTDNK